jgi:hypothetical protein
MGTTFVMFAMVVKVSFVNIRLTNLSLTRKAKGPRL